MNRQYFLNQLERISPEKLIKNDYSKLPVTFIGKDKLPVVCKQHGLFYQSAKVHMRACNDCDACNRLKFVTGKQERFLTLAKEIHGNKYDYSKTVLIDFKTKSEIVCLHHGSFWQSLYDHTSKKQGCPHCAVDAVKSCTSDFIDKANKIHNNYYDYSKVVYTTATTKVNITCKLHGDFLQQPRSHLNGNGCEQCFRDKYKLTGKEFIRNAQEVHGDKFDYSNVNYKGNKVKVEIVCSVHGSFWQTPNSHVSSRMGCRLCAESKGESAVETILKKYGIKHIREYKVFPFHYRYDFFLPEHNVFIEFNGIQHYKPVEMFGGQQAYLTVKKNDAIKKQIVKDLGAKLIVLTYLQLNDNVVEKELLARLPIDLKSIVDME